MPENQLFIYAIIGYPLVFFAFLEGLLGGLLMRRPARVNNVHLSAALMAISASLFCLSTGLAYILASWEVSNIIYQLAQ